MGSVICSGKKVSEVLSVLFGTVSRYQIQHNDTPQDALSHGQSDPAVRCHLLRHAACLLHSGEFRRKDHHGNHDSEFAEHLSSSRSGDQPSHFVGDATHRQIPALYDGSRHLFHHSDSFRSKHSLSFAVDARNVAVDSGALLERSSATSVHAATAGEEG